jgi:hypothetical protein
MNFIKKKKKRRELQEKKSMVKDVNYYKSIVVRK